MAGHDEERSDTERKMNRRQESPKKVILDTLSGIYIAVRSPGRHADSKEVVDTVLGTV